MGHIPLKTDSTVCKGPVGFRRFQLPCNLGERALFMKDSQFKQELKCLLRLSGNCYVTVPVILLRYTHNLHVKTRRTAIYTTRTQLMPYFLTTS
jgi:hypothetical protein